MDTKPVFLVSTGRTGTKFFSGFFARYGGAVSSLHYPPRTRVIHVLANAYEVGILSANAMQSLWRAQREKSIQNHEGRYVECNGYYYNLIDTIRASFPQAKFVFVVRSPKGFIRSHVNWERFQWKSTIAARLIPLWQPISYFEQLKGWRNNYHQRVEFYAKIWARKNASITAHASDPNCLRTVRYEDVFDETKGPRILGDLLDWLEIPVEKPILPEALTERVNLSRQKSEELWDTRCDEIVQLHCRDLMELYGYK